MRNFLLGALISVLTVIAIFYFLDKNQQQKTELASSDLILNQINNVGKLVVTEGHFSEVITYKDSKSFYMDLFEAEKKAIVVVNASATIAYDLSKINTKVDTEQKTVTITTIPEPEININPDIKYHELEEAFLNQFTPEDHNTIRAKVVEKLNQKIAASSLTKNAKNRLISELQKIYILTNSLGWKLIYEETPVETGQVFENLILD